MRKHTPLEMVQISEIMHHVKRLFDYYGEEMDFLDEYLHDILQKDVLVNLSTFRDLVSHLPVKKGWK